jgi:CHAD domain-containing protein
MAFCFKRKEPVSRAIRRLGRERIKEALECLDDCRRGEAIHCARKEIKKVRAVLRLVRTKIPKKDFRRLIRLLREAADHLAAPRDALVKANTLRDLARHFKEQLSPGAFRHVRAKLHRTFDEEMKCFGKRHTARAVRRKLRCVTKELGRLDVRGKGWKALRSGVKSAYGEGRRAYQSVRQDPSAENFHEWRKRAKDLGYQVTLLRPVRPEQIDAIARELEALGEYLGDDHDLVVLRATVEKQRADNGNVAELEILSRLIEQRQPQLRAAALALGARFYAEKPSTFGNRLAGYWEIWRREKKPAPNR